MNVRAVQKRLLHVLVAGDVRQNAQLDLGVIGVHQLLAVPGHKVATQAAAQLGADGDVLQVRLGGRDAPGAGLGLDKGGVHPTVRRLRRQQAIYVGRQQLGVGAVLQDLVDDRAVRAQAFQRGGVGGVAAGVFLARRQAQLVKQGFAQLLGAVHVELVAHLSVDILQDAVQLAPQAVAKGADAVGVYRKADTLHVRQHAGQRQLHLIVQFALAAGVQFGGQPFQQRGQHPGIGGGFAVERRRHAVLGSQ